MDGADVRSGVLAIRPRRSRLPPEVRLRPRDGSGGEQAHRVVRQGGREEGDRSVCDAGVRPMVRAFTARWKVMAFITIADVAYLALLIGFMNLVPDSVGYLPPPVVYFLVP